MEETTIKGYKASLQTQWEPLSEQHLTYLKRAEGYLAQYIDGNLDVPRIAITGAYRQGKTQFLLHILTYVLGKGGIAIYTHADLLVKLIECKVGKEGKIHPSDLPPLVKETIFGDIKKILSDQQPTLIHPDPEVIGYLKKHLPRERANKTFVLLIDELEQKYEQLQNKIDLDDPNPIRCLLDASDIYTVLAFAPRSVYEYKIGAVSGEGEAERGRFDLFDLPPASPDEIAKFLKVERQRANFIWWISRGRVGQAIRAYNNSLNYSLEEQAGFSSFVGSMGQISGVPCFNIDALVDREGNFTYDWKEVLNLVPCSSTSEAEWALLFKIDREFMGKATEFFGKRGFAGKHAVTLANYFTILLKAISGGDKEAIIKKKDAVALIRATYELMLEHTFDEKFITILQKQLEDIQMRPNLKITLPDFMEDARVAERVKSNKFLPFDFEKLMDFFPFPMSSPQLPGVSKEEVEEWIRKTGNLPLAEDEEGITNIMFFRDFGHFKKYCENERRTFVEKSLSEKKQTIAILLRGDVSQKDWPPLARWLERQGRLHVEKLRPSFLGEFLANGLFSIFKPEPGRPVPKLRKLMESLEQKFEKDRATLLKIHRHMTGSCEFVKSSVRGLKGSIKSFTYERRGAAFEGELRRQRASEGFFYPFTLAFYSEDSEGLRALAQVRSWSERSERPLYGCLSEKGGYRTAVRYFPITDKKGAPQHSESASVVQNAYKELISDLGDLAGLLSEDEFKMLVEDEIGNFILESYYKSRKFQGIGQGEKERVLEYLRQSLGIQGKILAEEKELKESIGIGFEASLKFSPEQQQAIEELSSLVEKADTWRSDVYQRVFFVFAEQIGKTVKDKADAFWKSLNSLSPEKYKSLKKLKELFSFPNQFPDEVFKYLEISRDALVDKLEKTREAGKAETTTIGGVHGGNVATFCEYFKDLIELQEHLETIKHYVNSLKAKVQRYEEIKGA